MFTVEQMRPLGKLQVGGDDRVVAHSTESPHGRTAEPLFLRKTPSDFVDDQEIHLGQASLQVGEPQAGLGFGQLVDKTGGC